MTVYLDRVSAILAEAESITRDAAAEATRADNDGGSISHGAAFRTLEGRWLALAAEVRALQVPPEMQEAHTLWVRSMAQEALALDDFATGFSTQDPALVASGAAHTNQFTELLSEATDKMKQWIKYRKS